MHRVTSQKFPDGKCPAPVMSLGAEMGSCLPQPFGTFPSLGCRLAGWNGAEQDSSLHRELGRNDRVMPDLDRC